MAEQVLEWCRANPALFEALVIVGLVVSIGSLIGVPWLVARLPADYFARPEPPPLPWARAHPVLRMALTSAKNLAGGLLCLAGVAMLFLPGQGLLTIVAGLVLVDFPGKRRAERALVRRPHIHRTLDWIRRKAGVAPLETPQ